MQQLPPHALGRPSPVQLAALPRLPVVLVLDDVRSGLNVGGIFRTADAFRAQGLVLAGITPQPPHREIHKTALGATDTVPWRHTPTAAQALHELAAQGYACLALEATTTSQPLPDAAPALPPNQPIALVLGNEVAGVGQPALDACTAGALHIPQYGAKHSLNVAAAAAVALYQFLLLHRHSL